MYVLMRPLSLRIDFHTSCSEHDRMFSQNGNFPVSSWYVTMPTDHMSALLLYDCMMTCKQPHGM